MTENPVQGPGPERETPERNNAGWNNAEVPYGAETGQSAGNPAGGEQRPGEQPTTRLPAYQPGEPVQPNEPVQNGQPSPSGQPAGQQAPGQSPQASPSYPQHAPFYGTGGGNHPGSGYPAPHHPAPRQHPTQQFPHIMGGPAGAQGGTVPDTKRKPVFGVGTLVASILAAGLVGGGVVAASNQLFDTPAPAASTSSQGGTVIVNNKDDVNVITAAAAKASPSVVTIKASSGSEGGTGSGIIIDDQGHILTNTHVVTLDGATANASIEVRTHEGRVLKATVVGTDPLSDLAVIKVVDPSGLVPATLGDSSKINVGDTAVAIGSPLGLTGTVTDGIVSTLNRTISVASSAAPKEAPDSSNGNGDGGFEFAPPGEGRNQPSADQGSISINVIQTDAAINPGNSGGALVNSKGEVIGVNVAIASAGSGTTDSSSGNIGVGFSIPINHAKRVAEEIIKNGKASHGQFGVSVQAKSATGSSSGFSVGAEVASVTKGSAAEKAGVKVGDVVVKFAGQVISDPNQLTAAVREQAAGASVKATILRNGQEREIDVTLDSAPQQ
ncbi:trypsin-like peptidase domain-containing protein [Arthrobacter silvisoli]|uniref:trypsin-like peptidase domain-containing protein n=1 Tax=Arthrobacter silvisoli TaxID=2291022 RepID=UPI000E21A893|nr:trypsin-like peptidase domain-containing protein [Arthrobacter silvisoli]